jgi:hypothetical protein
LEFGRDVSREKGSGWHSGLKPGFLINACGREARRLQYQLNAREAIRRGYGEPSKRPMRDVRLLGETQYSRVEVERFGLVVNCDACEFDLHDVFTFVV